MSRTPEVINKKEAIFAHTAIFKEEIASEDLEASPIIATHKRKMRLNTPEKSTEAICVTEPNFNIPFRIVEENEEVEDCDESNSDQ